MQTQTERLRGIRRLALLLTGLSVLVVCVSAYIRLNGAGLGCGTWPECYGQVIVGGPQPHSGAVRILHRVAASLALLLGFFAAWRCLRPTPLRQVASQATQLVSLMILLTFVGIFSADVHRAWASFINIVGGAALVAMSWRLAANAGSAAPAPPPSRAGGAVHAGLALLVVAIALGALIGARYAARACASLPFCDGVAWPAAAGLTALNPFVTIASATPPGDDGGVALHLLHRYAALATLAILGVAGLRALAWAATRGTAVVLLALLATQFALGVLTVLGGFPLELAIAHGVGATVLLAVGVHLLIRFRRRAE